MSQPIRVLVVDDHAVVRQGMAAMIKPRPDMEMIGEAADGVEAVEKARVLKPDVILMDLVMPGKSGIEAIREIMDENPTARILVLTSFTDENKVLAAIKAGAAGYVLKISSPEELVRAIRDIHKGDAPIHPNIARKLLDNMTPTQDGPAAKDELTNRETEVLKLVARGLSNKDISKQLHISDGTVRSHINHILDKLQVSNRVQAVLFALREGMTSLD